MAYVLLLHAFPALREAANSLKRHEPEAKDTLNSVETWPTVRKSSERT